MTSLPAIADRRELQALELIAALATVADWRARCRLYRTTLTSCQCRDSLYRPSIVCKHRRVYALIQAQKDGAQ
jgi:hypothetical protein